MAEYRLYDVSGDYLFRRGLSWAAVGLREEGSVFSLTSRLRANEHERMRARTSGARGLPRSRPGRLGASTVIAEKPFAYVLVSRSAPSAINSTSKLSWKSFSQSANGGFT